MREEEFTEFIVQYTNINSKNKAVRGRVSKIINKAAATIKII